MKNMYYAMLSLLLSLPFQAVDAQELSLPAIFRDHMVLQRDVPVPVWGTAKPGSAITVKFADQEKTAQAGVDGTWQVELKPMAANASSRVLTVENVTFEDVLVGEVWLCSGQSNMQFVVGKRDQYPGVEHRKEAIEKPERKGLRLFTDDGLPVWEKRGWQQAGGEAVARFSATAFFFGERLHRELGVPVGVINVSRGGSVIQTWTQEPFALRNPFTKHYVDLMNDSREEILAFNTATHEARLAKIAGKKNIPKVTPLSEELDIARLFRLGVCYDLFVEPVAPYAIRGVIWYQGESNGKWLKMAKTYNTMLPDLIEGWRNRWGQPEMPWYVMQLPSF